MEYMLQMKDIVKEFPGVMAVNHVDLEVKPKEVLALVGENGAGKSTLMKILSGAYSPDSGTVTVAGKQIERFDPQVAIAHGVAMIYQELNYIESVSIAENIFAGRLPLKGILKKVDYKRLRSETEELLRQVGVNRDPFEGVVHMTVAERQLIEIAKAISQRANIIVFDEPTSALNETESENLLNLIRKLTAEGRSVIYITHKLDEIFQIANQVLVMRDGCRVDSLPIEQLTKDDMIRMMVGREIGDMYPIHLDKIGDVVLDVSNLSGGVVRDSSFSVKKGEVLGVFGLMGAGQTEMMELLYGARPKQGGSILVEGQKAVIKRPWDAQRHGIMYLPPERKSQGILPNMSVKENMTISNLKLLQRGGMLNLRKERKIVQDWIERFNVKTPTMDKMITELSGGNQQKVLIAKSLIGGPKVVIINEPTRGVDVGAKAEIYSLLEMMCEQGLAIIAICSEIQEVMAISNRAICVHDGTITGELTKEEFSQENFLRLAIGEGVKA